MLAQLAYRGISIQWWPGTGSLSQSDLIMSKSPNTQKNSVRQWWMKTEKRASRLPRSLHHPVGKPTWLCGRWPGARVEMRPSGLVSVTIRSVALPPLVSSMFVGVFILLDRLDVEVPPLGVTAADSTEHGRDLLVALLQMQAALLAITIALSIILSEALETRRILGLGYMSLVARTTRGLNFTAAVVILLTLTILSLALVPTVLAAYTIAALALGILVYFFVIYRRYNDVLTDLESRSRIAEENILDKLGQSVSQGYGYDQANALYSTIGSELRQGNPRLAGYPSAKICLDLDYNDILYRDDNPFRDDFLVSRIHRGRPFFRLGSSSQGRLTDVDMRSLVSTMEDLVRNFCDQHELLADDQTGLDTTFYFELVVAIGHFMRRGQSIATLKFPPVDHRSRYRPPSYLMKRLRRCLVVRSEPDAGRLALEAMDAAIQKSLKDDDYTEIRIALRIYVAALADLHRYEGAVRRCDEIIPTLHLHPSHSLDRLDAYRDVTQRFTQCLHELSRRTDDASLQVARELGYIAALSLGEASSSEVIIDLLKELRKDHHGTIRVSKSFGCCPQDLAFDVCSGLIRTTSIPHDDYTIGAFRIGEAVLTAFSARIIARMLADSDIWRTTEYAREQDKMFRSVLMFSQATFASLAAAMVDLRSSRPMVSCFSAMLSSVESLGDFVEEIRQEAGSDRRQTQYSEFTHSIVTFYDELRTVQLALWLMCVIIAHDSEASWSTDLPQECAELLDREALERSSRLELTFPGPVRRQEMGLPSRDDLAKVYRLQMSALLQKAKASTSVVANSAREGYVTSSRYRFSDNADWWWPLLAENAHDFMNTWRTAVRDRDISVEMDQAAEAVGVSMLAEFNDHCQ